MIVPFTVKAQIKGVVCDENQNPVEFANVILMGTDSVYIAGTVTDVSGKFDFLTAYSGGYPFSISGDIRSVSS